MTHSLLISVGLRYAGEREEKKRKKKKEPDIDHQSLKATDAV